MMDREERKERIRQMRINRIPFCIKQIRAKKQELAWIQTRLQKDIAVLEAMLRTYRKEDECDDLG